MACTSHSISRFIARNRPSPTSSSCHPLVDRQNRILGVLGGQPKDREGWQNVVQAASDGVESAGPRCKFNEKQSIHRRGAFPALACGMSFGGGQMVRRHPPPFQAGSPFL